MLSTHLGVGAPLEPPTLFNPDTPIQLAIAPSAVVDTQTVELAAILQPLSLPTQSSQPSDVAAAPLFVLGLGLALFRLLQPLFEVRRV